MARRRQVRAGRRRSRGLFGLLRWLGLGGLLVGLVALLRPVPPRRRIHSRDDVSPGADPAVVPATDLHEGWLPAPGGSVRVLECHPGAPRAVVFVHGLGGSADQWLGQLEALGSGLHGIALDLPGHGGSDPVDDYTLDALASALGAALDGCRVRRTVLVAHSLGAQVALRYAAQRPGRVESVLLVDPAGDQTAMPDEDRERFVDAVVEAPHDELRWHAEGTLGPVSKEVAQRVLSDLDNARTEALTGFLRAAAVSSPCDDVARFDGRVELVVSELGTTPYSLSRRCPDLPCRRLDGLGHWLMLSAPDVVNRLLDDFLASGP